MVMGILAACGLWLGRTVPGGAANPKGFFENWVLRERINKAILRQAGCDPLGVTPLPPLERLPQATNLRAAVLAAIAREGYDGQRPWGFKDAKLTLTWPIWRRHFPEARWVLVRRSTDDVVSSCLRTPFMAQHSNDPKFWHQFAEAYIARLNVLKRSEVWWREIWAEEIIADRFDNLTELLEVLDLEPRVDKVREFVEPRFWGRDDDG